MSEPSRKSQLSARLAPGAGRGTVHRRNNGLRHTPQQLDDLAAKDHALFNNLGRVGVLGLAMLAMSPPAQKALPAPVMIMQRTLRSVANCSSWARS